MKHKNVFDENNHTIAEPQKSKEGFSDQILADLISQGYSGDDLLIKFKEISKSSCNK